jgi:hypothetical protein
MRFRLRRSLSVGAVRLLLFIACLVALVVAGVASAYRAPSRSERAQIVDAILSYQQQQNCGAVHTCKPQITRVRVSLANQSYATAFLYIPSVGGVLALLHKRYGTWRVTDLGSQFVGCGKAPKAVRVDLEIRCAGGK